MKLKIKIAKLKDAKFIYSLRNDNISRKNSINQKKIKYGDHLLWLKKKLSTQKGKIFIIYGGITKKNIAYVRFDKSDFFTRVSIAIHKKFRGKGLSYNVLSSAEQQINEDSLLLADVNKKNLTSCKLFKKLNYIVIKKEKKFIKFAKIVHKNYKKEIFQQTINKIQETRKKNNVNWMDILRIAFSSSPKQTSKIFKKISICDGKINNLSKVLSK